MNGWFIPATASLLVATGAGVGLDVPLLQYGALGLLGLIIILNYRIGNRMLDKLDNINRDCHSWGANREERLNVALKEVAQDQKDIVEQVMSEVRRKGTGNKE